MGIEPANHRRTFFIFSTALAMLAGLFVSRAALSVSLFLFLGGTLLHKNIGAQLRNFFKTPWLLGMALLFLVPFASGLWSTNSAEWQRLMRLKLPLLFLPLAFAGNWQLSSKQWRVVAVVFLMLVTLGTAWSFENYWGQRAAVAESYLRAKSLLTPLGNDHVRFSWLVAVAFLLCLYFIETGPRRVQWLCGLLALWLVVYLHVLAARTGLFSLYLMLVYYAFFKLAQRGTFSILMLGATALLLPLLAWLTLPTFQNRIKYFVYDLSFIKSGAYLPGGNDGNRVQSIKAGWHLLKNNPLGVGAGDVFDETNAWYLAHVPGMLPTDKLYPSSEWLLYGGSTGWPGVALFTLALLLPFYFRPAGTAFYWRALCGTAAFSFLFDIGLEVQYGVFTYAFLLLWWWKWFSKSAA